MALRKIREIGDPCLKKVCREVDKFDSRLHTLLDDMAETLAEANGVGLAAPQVTYLMQELKEKGASVDTEATTVEEAAETIEKWLRQR